jgi:GntR family transcriptional regulator
MTSAAQLRARLLASITSDDLKPGDQLPTEAKLAERFGVARSTVREALKLLEQDGIVHAIQGRGRFLSPLGSVRVERPITVYESISEMLANLGYRVTTLVLGVEEATADERVASALDISAGDPLIRLVRLRLGDDEPMVLSVNSIVRDCLPGPVSFRDWSTSITEALAAHGHPIASSVARISATDLPAEYAERYDLGQFDPWLLIEETGITHDGARVLHALDYHRGSEFTFNVLRRR